MKHLAPVLLAMLVAACNATPEATPAATAPAAPASAPQAAAAVKRGATTGVVQSIDATAKTITIAHGPVEALGWPGMTMTFQAPATDLSAFQAGDKVAFEFDSTGSDGTIVAITKQ
jgi:Cu(I)/Ag(I) efflux system protein CusF